MMRHLFFAVLLSAGLIATALAAEVTLDEARPLERGWYTAHRLLPKLAERDGIRWAMPETLAGLALVGGEDVPARAVLDDACTGWGLTWTVTNGVVVIHRADDAKLEAWTETLAAGGEDAPEAAWELGWLADARALPALARALASDDTSVALAAAQAVAVLDRCVPLGRTHRVDPPLPGRVPLAAAYLPDHDLSGLLGSEYPPVRAAALRLMLGQGGASARAAADRTADDNSVLVQQVRQQMLFDPPDEDERAEAEALPPAPDTPEEVRAASRTMLEEIEPLAQRSQWERMRRRVRVMAEWSRRGHEEAADALIELSDTRVQRGWFPDYVQMFMTSTGGEKVEAKLRELFAQGNRDTVVRGLEQGRYGADLLSFTRPHLGEQTVCYVTARKAGRAAYDDLLGLATEAQAQTSHLIDAIGVIGGARATAVLIDRLHHDEPNSGTLAFRSAKALGHAGTVEALEALITASRSPDRFRRHAATLFLGRIGGPRAVERLEQVLDDESDRLVRAAAADALEQIGAAPEAVAAFRESDRGLPRLEYQPRNERLGADFPTGEWVNLGIRIRAFANYGEMGWNYDAANRLFFRQGGCSGYTNELTVFDLGTETFVQRRPYEQMAGWGDRRPPRGCSGGRTWDPYLKVAWIGPAIGGTVSDLAIEEYYNRDGGYRIATYDLATDRFQEAARPVNCGRYVYDWRNGLMIPVTFTHRNHRTKDWWVLDTRAPDPRARAAWRNKTNQEGDYPFISSHRYTTAAVHQPTGTLVVYVPQHMDRHRQEQVGPETWTWDPRANIWRNMEPDVQPNAGVWGSGFVYDPFAQTLILHAGRRVSQYGGEDDAMTWSYDPTTNTWTDLGPGGPGNPWVGAMAFDPEHNVVVLFRFRGGDVWAYRHRSVPVGTVAELPEEEQ